MCCELELLLGSPDGLPDCAASAARWERSHCSRSVTSGTATSRCTAILASNCGFTERGEIFRSPVVVTAILDRLLYHAMVVQIEGFSYRSRRTPTSCPSPSARLPPSLRAAADRAETVGPTPMRSPNAASKRQS